MLLLLSPIAIIPPFQLNIGRNRIVNSFQIPLSTVLLREISRCLFHCLVQALIRINDLARHILLSNISGRWLHLASAA